MDKPWLEGVRGDQVLPLIESEDRAIRVEAGPGTGKTFGLVRRVLRLLHPDGGGVKGREILIVAFNRVIAQALREEIEEALAQSPHDGDPTISTVHAQCLRIIREENLRLLLDHERDAMLYDVMERHPVFKERYGTHAKVDQALKDHEAKHKEDMELWEAVQGWLVRHQAKLISDLPGMLLDSLHSGDFGSVRYRHVIVDEFQDLTPGEQKLFTRLRTADGSFVALGDPRQSIYRFRGNDLEGLSKLEELLSPEAIDITDVPMTECQRCPADIVAASNQLMVLSPAQPMVPGSGAPANTHLIHWDNPQDEAAGMAKAIVDNVHKHPDERHLVMVTRKRFGFWLRDEITRMDPTLSIDLSFSESLLDTWAVREAFVFFCLLVDPDAPTWRAWLGYKNSKDGKNYKAAKRNAGAYLQLLTASADHISDGVIDALLTEQRTRHRGGGGSDLWDRAERFKNLKGSLSASPDDPDVFIKEVFSSDLWVTTAMEDRDEALGDLDLARQKAEVLLEEIRTAKPDIAPDELLRAVARRLRYQIATREPFTAAEGTKVQVSTMWGAKGITAHHVYVLGLCDEALPGTRRPEYPGTDEEYREEQRRLFYVSLTRAKKTLVLSRALEIKPQVARTLGIKVTGTTDTWFPVRLRASQYLRNILQWLPQSVPGDTWTLD